MNGIAFLCLIVVGLTVYGCSQSHVIDNSTSAEPSQITQWEDEQPRCDRVGDYGQCIIVGEVYWDRRD